MCPTKKKLSGSGAIWKRHSNSGARSSGREGNGHAWDKRPSQSSKEPAEAKVISTSVSTKDRCDIYARDLAFAIEEAFDSAIKHGFHPTSDAVLDITAKHLQHSLPIGFSIAVYTTHIIAQGHGMTLQAYWPGCEPEEECLANP